MGGEVGGGGEDLETERGRRQIDRHINRDDDNNDTLLCKDKGLIRQGIKTFRSLQTEIKQNKGKSNARLICRDSERVRQREREREFLDFNILSTMRGTRTFLRVVTTHAVLWTLHDAVGWG